jgi:hypothetical protein
LALADQYLAFIEEARTVVQGTVGRARVARDPQPCIFATQLMSLLWIIGGPIDSPRRIRREYGVGIRLRVLTRDPNNLSPSQMRQRLGFSLRRGVDSGRIFTIVRASAWVP